MQIESYLVKLENLYNRRVKPQMFQLGDLVLRIVFENTTDPSAGKFQPNWEGQSIGTQASEFRLYAIEKLDETLVPRMWNVMHLKRYYQ